MVTAARPQHMRALNEQLLLEELRRHGWASRADLVRASGLSKPTVGLALANLERAALVRAAGRRTGGRGRTAALYELRADAGYVLGLDVGREYIRGALADVRGHVRVRESRAARAESGRGRVRELTALADALLEQAGVDRDASVVHTVVGTPGVVDPARGVLRMAPNFPDWERPQVLKELRAHFGEAAAFENDVDAAAIAERDHGHGRSVSTFAFVSVGTGVGMGLVIDGRLHRGANGAAGEIAFLPFGGDHSQEARRHGALEAAASADGVVRAAHAAGMTRAASARSVFAAAERGDRRAQAVVAAEAELIARALASVAAVVDPELVVLGGGIGRARGFADSVAARLADWSPAAPAVRVSALGDDAVVDGCLASGIEQLWERVLRSRDVEVSA
jgi:predicted NBD/HSP70 family sugar kinase